MDNMPAQYTPPFWRQAVEHFLAGKFAPGDLVSYEWLYREFEIVIPIDDMPVKEAKKSELAFLGAFKSFEGTLLRDHQIALSNIRGVGYQYVHPVEQTKWAEDHGDAEVKKSLRKRRDRLVNVRLEALNADQRRQNMDGLARLGLLQGMTRRALERKSVMEIEEQDDERSDE